MMFRQKQIGVHAALVAAFSLAAVVAAYAQMFGADNGAGMMGGYGMGPGMMMGAGLANRPVDADWGGGVLSYGQVEGYIRDGRDRGKVDAKANSVIYDGTDVTINMVAVQPVHHDQTFEVGGLTDPTLVVPLGARVHLSLVNMDYGDNMEHGLILTPAPPPYPYMAMMKTGSGVAQVRSLLPWRSEKSVAQARYAVLSTDFIAQQPGTYWYVCPTSQHAEKGMYGRFVIR